MLELDSPTSAAYARLGDAEATARLDPWLEVQVVEEHQAGWARVVCSNTWSARAKTSSMESPVSDFWAMTWPWTLGWGVRGRFGPRKV